MVQADTKAISVAFRVDASLQIGTGHVMRCLTLANALKARGAQCHFLCREHPGNLIEQIKSKGHRTHPLAGSHLGKSTEFPAAQQTANAQAHKSIASPHASWLGASQEEDAASSAVILNNIAPDWLVVDHYALDERWERSTKPAKSRLMVIDDLADRLHVCDLLLDQNLGRTDADYDALVPSHCKLLTGPSYALLRPEFAQHRRRSLARRQTPALKHLLITMGGVDRDNATGKVLDALKLAKLPKDCHITVIMGAQAPWLQEVNQLADTLPWSTEVRIDVNDMGRLMARADLAIGAAGSTSWERCCLGLPTLMIVLADNQLESARALQQQQAAILLGEPDQAVQRLAPLLLEMVKPETLKSSCYTARSVTDGLGADRVCDYLLVNRCASET